MEAAQTVMKPKQNSKRQARKKKKRNCLTKLASFVFLNRRNGTENDVLLDSNCQNKIKRLIMRIHDSNMVNFLNVSKRGKGRKGKEGKGRGKKETGKEKKRKRIGRKRDMKERERKEEKEMGRTRKAREGKREQNTGIIEKGGTGKERWRQNRTGRGREEEKREYVMGQGGKGVWTRKGR